MWKDKKFIILLVLEAVLLLGCLVAFALRGSQEYSFEASVFSQREDGTLFSDLLTLPRGIYEVELVYDCQGSMDAFCNVTGVERVVLSSGEHLFSGVGHTGFDLWIRASHAEVTVEISGVDNVTVEQLIFHRTGRDLARTFLLILLAAILVDVLYLVHQYDVEWGIVPEKKRIAGCLLLIIGASSIPLFVNYLYPGSDVTYHLLRIDNLKESLLQGQFPVRIDSYWLWGHGYASSVCYGETLLYIPAFLRIVGFTLQESYFAFLLLLNMGTCLVSYFSFKGMLKDRMTGVLCSMLYTLSIYRLYKMYCWNALGEVQAILFLPLILYGVYELLREDTKGPEYQNKWIPLAIGVSGILQCHILTCEMTVFFLGITCVILWKRLFRRDTLLVVAKAVCATLALSAWFLIPFLDYILNVDMVIGHVSARTIQENGLYFANLFHTFFRRGASRNFGENGMRDMEALGVGLPMMIAAISMLLLWFFGGRTVLGQEGDGEADAKKRMTGGKFTVCLGILAMLMSLSVFPWTRLQFLNRYTATLISSIQYPNRFLMMATLFLTLTAGFVTVCLAKWRKTWSYCYALGLAGIGMIAAFFYISSLVLDANPLVMYDVKGMGSGYLSGAEYLRYGLNTDELDYHAPAGSEGVWVSHWEKDGLKVVMDLDNSHPKDGYVDVPLQNYKGYVAKNLETGERLEIEDGAHFDVRVRVPAGFTGKIQVAFISSWYWRASEALSLISGVGLILYGVRMRKNAAKDFAGEEENE